jgi:predicted transcriptional regulator
MMTEFRTQESAFGASAVFRVASGTLTTTLASQLPRREHWVLLLVDGKRSVAELARLTQRSELNVAYTLARFLRLGYIEPVNAVEYTTSQFESRYNSS